MSVNMIARDGDSLSLRHQLDQCRLVGKQDPTRRWIKEPPDTQFLLVDEGVAFTIHAGDKMASEIVDFDSLAYARVPVLLLRYEAAIDKFYAPEKANFEEHARLSARFAEDREAERVTTGLVAAPMTARAVRRLDPASSPASA